MGIIGQVAKGVAFGRLLVNPGNWPAMKAAAYISTNSDPAECSACGYVGKFVGAGHAYRPRTKCPRCNSLERHRLIALALSRGEVDLTGKRVLHFAPEVSVSELVRRVQPEGYDTADLVPGRAELVLNIEAIALPENSYDRVICNHVLEHVDDKKAFAEIFRILRPGGELLAMVPMVEGWQQTYENPEVAATEEGRKQHFGQDDHIRYYGADFRDRIKAAGFHLREITALGADSARYALIRGEKIFVGSKPA